VIGIDGCDRYMAALETASVKDDAKSFAEFLAEQVQRSNGPHMKSQLRV